MIIDVTYEKADILKVVEEDLRKRGLHIKPGSKLDYKGALQVKLSIDVDDMASEAAVEQEAAPRPPEKAKVTLPPPLEEEEEVAPELEPESERVSGGASMGDILTMSSKLAEKDGKFVLKKGSSRQLAPNETYEYPDKE